MKKIVLDIWGFPIMFRNAPPQVIDELYDTFYGAIREISADQKIVLTVTFSKGSKVPNVLANLKEIRMHGGGSSAKKYFTDKTLFNRKSQERFCYVLAESTLQAIYIREQTVIQSIAGQYFIFYSVNIPEMLVSDLVENFLLFQAREHNWIMAHAAGWIHNGTASLIIGNSGMGKTTTLFDHIRQGDSFFSNDRVFLRRHQGRFEARSFPLPVNIGCGTIRALNLKVSHFDFPDDYKIRLTPHEIAEIFNVDFMNWYPVSEVLTKNSAELQENIYWDEDENHPFWNIMYQPKPMNERKTLNDFMESASVTRTSFINK